MAKETTKAQIRRMRENNAGLFHWDSVFKGKILDAGSGDDPINLPNVTPFDTPQGDLNHLSRYFKPETFDVIHSSNSLEHLYDPKAALADWLKVVKPGGHLVITVPSWELYEGMQWPSRYNPDHKSSWSLWQKGSPAPIHVFLPDFLDSFKNSCDVLLCRLVDTNYNYKVGTSSDQTWIFEHSIEAFLEFVLRKK